jgi:hypothetical protein
MGCEKEPEQLVLGLDSYTNFRRMLLGPKGQTGPLGTPWRRGQFNPAVRSLAMWAEANDYLSCATWTKKLLVDLRFHEERGTVASRLVLAFGHAFRGDQVGAPGRDIVEYALKRQDVELRRAALEVLERWLPDDEDGVWLDLLNDHIDFEEDRQLKGQCIELVQRELDVLEEADQDPPELEEYLAVCRQLHNRARFLIETSELPRVLEKVVDVDQRLALAVLESVKIGKLTIDDDRHGFLLSRVGGGWQLKAWRLDGEASFSVEPTATEGNWLVFARF